MRWGETKPNQTAENEDQAARRKLYCFMADVILLGFLRYASSLTKDVGGSLRKSAVGEQKPRLEASATIHGVVWYPKGKYGVPQKIRPFFRNRTESLNVSYLSEVYQDGWSILGRFDMDERAIFDTGLIGYAMLTQVCDVDRVSWWCWMGKSERKEGDSFRNNMILAFVDFWMPRRQQHHYVYRVICQSY